MPVSRTPWETFTRGCESARKSPVAAGVYGARGIRRFLAIRRGSERTVFLDTRLMHLMAPAFCKHSSVRKMESAPMNAL